MLTRPCQSSARHSPSPITHSKLAQTPLAALFNSPCSLVCELTGDSYARFPKCALGYLHFNFLAHSNTDVYVLSIYPMNIVWMYNTWIADPIKLLKYNLVFWMSHKQFTSESKKIIPKYRIIYFVREERCITQESKLSIWAILTNWKEDRVDLTFSRLWKEKSPNR